MDLKTLIEINLYKVKQKCTLFHKKLNNYQKLKIKDGFKKLKGEAKNFHCFIKQMNIHQKLKFKNGDKFVRSVTNLLNIDVKI